MKDCSIWLFAQISEDFYYLDIWQCAKYFAALFKDCGAMKKIVKLNRFLAKVSASRHIQCMPLPYSRMWF